VHATILIQLHWPLQHERQARVTAEPSIISSAIIAWRDAFTAFVRMPATFGVATLLMFVLRLATLGPLTPVQPAFDVGFLLLLFASGMVSCLLLTPAAVAVHRYVLLG
jgi:hypothetical protein